MVTLRRSLGNTGMLTDAVKMQQHTGTPTPIAVPKANNPELQELGGSGLRQNSGFINEEFLTRLHWPAAGEIYQEMSHNDPVVTAMLLVSKQLFRNVSWSVKAASDSQADQQAAEFLRECMNDMATTWLDFIEEITSYFEYGWAYHEIVYKRRDGYSRDEKKSSKYDDQRIGWKRMPGRSQVSLAGWAFDDENEFKGMYQQVAKGPRIQDVLIPIERSLLFRTTTARGNPEGKSFLRGAYRPWYFKKHIEEIEGIGVERDLAGLPVVMTPENVDIFNPSDNPANIAAKTGAERIVASIRNDRNAGVVLPYGWDLKLLSSGSSRLFDTSTIINRYDQRIAITMLADIVMLGADKVGSFALAKVKESMLATCLDAQLKSIVDILNRTAVPRLFSYNTFPGITDYPQFQTGTVVAPDLKELGEYIKSLTGSQMNMFPDDELENFLRGVAGLPLKPVDFQEGEANARRGQNAEENEPPAQDRNTPGTQRRSRNTTNEGGE